MQITQCHAVLSALSLIVLAELLHRNEAVHLRHSRNTDGSQSGFFDYGYAMHGLDWKQGECSSQGQQSPIDLPASAPVSPQQSTFQYKYRNIDQPFELINNGHTLAGDFAGLGYGGIVYDTAFYSLMNINLHSVSEHSWQGQKKPLELHLVHKHFSEDKLLIVAVPVVSPTPPPHPAFLQQRDNSTGRYGPATSPFQANYIEPPSSEPDWNPTIQAFVKLQPPAVNMKVNVPTPIQGEQPYNLNSLVANDDYLEYSGSLTAPPCAEIVTWLVRKTPIKASDKQVLYLHDSIYKTTADFGNYRSLMPLAGRSIQQRKAVIDGTPEIHPPPPNMDAFGNPQASDREFRAMKWAMDAMTIAKASTDYIKDLDMRVRNAAQAHADALSPLIDPLSTNGAIPAVQPPLGATNLGGFGPGHEVEMANAAQTMAGKLAEAAREEIQDATKEITAKAREAALRAAAHAQGIVVTGYGNVSALANVVTGPGHPPNGQIYPPGFKPGAIPPETPSAPSSQADMTSGHEGSKEDNSKEEGSEHHGAKHDGSNDEDSSENNSDDDSSKDEDSNEDGK